jgi:coenzyme F420 hydrogenase subunit beta
MPPDSPPRRPFDPSVLSIGFFNEDLCTRCGTCGGACPEGAVAVTDTRFPRLLEEKCTACGLCAKVCPGDKVPYGILSRLTYGVEDRDAAYDGRTLATYIGHSADPAIRERGAGGGVITALLWDLLRHGDVDGCVVTRMNPERPWEGEPFIARTREDLLSSQGSKYSVIPVNHILAEVRRRPGRYALALLPCQVHGYRLLAQEDPALADKIAVVVGLFCGGALEPHLVPEMLRAKGLRREDLADFQFRGGEWPGKFRAVLKDGRVVPMHNYNYDDGAYNHIIQLYAPRRCQTCVDGSAKFADVSVGDFWTRDVNGEFIARARSRLLVRTDRGHAVVRQALNRGSIVGEDMSGHPDYRTHRMQTRRKGTGAPLRVERWGTRGIAVPKYDLTFGPFTWRERLAERVASAILWCGRHRWIRYPLLKFLLSPWSKPLIWMRRTLKKRKYARLKRAAERRAAAASR